MKGHVAGDPVFQFESSGRKPDWGECPESSGLGDERAWQCRGVCPGDTSHSPCDGSPPFPWFFPRRAGLTGVLSCPSSTVPRPGPPSRASWDVRGRPALHQHLAPTPPSGSGCCPRPALTTGAGDSGSGSHTCRLGLGEVSFLHSLVASVSIPDTAPHRCPFEATV